MSEGEGGEDEEGREMTSASKLPVDSERTKHASKNKDSGAQPHTVYYTEYLPFFSNTKVPGG